MYEIEKSIPIPIESKSKYPIQSMEVGDSFLIKNIEGNKKVAARSVIGKAARAHNIAVITRTVDDGLRVWRVQ